MKTLFKITILYFSMFVTTCFADVLILSTQLKIEYPTPLAISHGISDLIVKYNQNRSFMHVVVDPKEMYQQIDLSGIEREYIRSIFDVKQREKLSEQLSTLSKKQSDEFGVTKDNVERIKVGTAEVIAVYNYKSNNGLIFIFAELAVHQIYTYGTKKEHDLILYGIKKR